MTPQPTAYTVDDFDFALPPELIAQHPSPERSGARLLDGTGAAEVATGLKFLDHMLSQLARHGRLDLSLRCVGDLEVDDHQIQRWRGCN